MRPVRPFSFAACLTLGLVLAVVGGGAASLPTARPAAASDDPFFPQQWNLAQVHAEPAWAKTTGAGITIGVVDTGVDSSHPDLQGKIDATANCIGGTCKAGNADDGHGHGTIVAGIIAADTGNGRGIAGVAPDAHLVVAKAVNDQGEGDVDDITAGIKWAVDRGAKVVNLSLGDPNFLLTSLLGTPLRPGIEYAWSHGAVPVLASGNENTGVLGLGSSNYGSLDAIVVGATDRSGGVASYSSAIGNAKWGLVAPGGSGGGAGEDVLSTYPGGRYAWVAGTSMAAPHVAGAVALLLSQGLSPTNAIQRLLSTADRSVKCGTGCQGRLDIAAAVAAGGSGATIPTVPSTPVPTSPATTAPVVTAPVVTAAPTTTTPTTVPTTTESTTVHPEQRTLAAGPLDASDDPSRNPAILVLAFALIGGVGSAAGLVAWSRRRTGDVWPN